MKYLFDVNVLVAWGWNTHVFHQRAIDWIESVISRRETRLLTSSIPELGFVRISVQGSGGAVSVEKASEVLRSMLGSLGNRHEYVVDNLPSTGDWPAWCSSAKQTSDAHLLILAEMHGAKLATLDTGIPGAFAIPAMPR